MCLSCIDGGKAEDPDAWSGVLQRECLIPVDLHPEVTRVFHRELTRLKVMFCGLCLGQDMRDLPFRFGYC